MGAFSRSQLAPPLKPQVGAGPARGRAGMLNAQAAARPFLASWASLGPQLGPRPADTARSAGLLSQQAC